MTTNVVDTLTKKLFTRLYRRDKVTEQDLINFSNNVIKLIREDAGRFDDAVETVIKNSIIYEMRKWTYITQRKAAKKKEPKVVKPKPSEDGRKELVFQMLQEGKKSNEIEKALGVSGFTVFNYKKEWHHQQRNAEVKTKGWYEQEYPGLHESMYEALASGKISDTVIRRNRW